MLDAVVLVMVLRHLHLKEQWLQAFQNVGSFTWCKDKRAPVLLDGWLESLRLLRQLDGETIREIKRYIVVKMVSLQWQLEYTGLCLQPVYSRQRLPVCDHES